MAYKNYQNNSPAKRKFTILISVILSIAFLIILYGSIGEVLRVSLNGEIQSQGIIYYFGQGIKAIQDDAPNHRDSYNNFALAIMYILMVAYFLMIGVTIVLGTIQIVNMIKNIIKNGWINIKYSYFIFFAGLTYLFFLFTSHLARNSRDYIILGIGSILIIVGLTLIVAAFILDIIGRNMYVNSYYDSEDTFLMVVRIISIGLLFIIGLLSFGTTLHYYIVYKNSSYYGQTNLYSSGLSIILFFLDMNPQLYSYHHPYLLPQAIGGYIVYFIGIISLFVCIALTLNKKRISSLLMYLLTSVLLLVGALIMGGAYKIYWDHRDPSYDCFFFLSIEMITAVVLSFINTLMNSISIITRRE